jgi:acyl-CoA synthetase (AMP-forming)/AMP-acid ligase II
VDFGELLRAAVGDFPVSGITRPAVHCGLHLGHLQARVVATDGSHGVLPPGEVGELQIRGPVTMKEYLGRPEATAQTAGGGRVAAHR